MDPCAVIEIHDPVGVPADPSPGVPDVPAAIVPMGLRRHASAATHAAASRRTPSSTRHLLLARVASVSRRAAPLVSNGMLPSVNRSAGRALATTCTCFRAILRCNLEEIPALARCRYCFRSFCSCPNAAGRRNARGRTRRAGCCTRCTTCCAHREAGRGGRGCTGPGMGQWQGLSLRERQVLRQDQARLVHVRSRCKGQGRPRGPRQDVLIARLLCAHGTPRACLGGTIRSLFDKPAEGSRIPPAGLIMSVIGALIPLLAWDHLTR